MQLKKIKNNALIRKNRIRNKLEIQTDEMAYAKV